MLPKPKPIRRSALGITSRTNVPYDEPLTPGLRRPPPVNAIGFTTDTISLCIEAPALRDKIRWD